MRHWSWGPALLLAGLAAGFYGRGFSKATPPRNVKAVEHQPSSTVNASEISMQSQLAAGYLAAIKSASQLKPSEGNVPSDDPQVNEPTPEDYVRQARSEPVDAAWAPQQTAALGAELALASAHLGFRYSNLDCRTHQCNVDLDWHTLKDARTAFKTGFATEFSQTKCMQRLLLPEGAREDAPARSTLILTCARPNTTPRAVP
jgi:hypothetical protein